MKRVVALLQNFPYATIFWYMSGTWLMRITGKIRISLHLWVPSAQGETLSVFLRSLLKILAES
jgi:hypothetical protein